MTKKILAAAIAAACAVALTAGAAHARRRRPLDARDQPGARLRRAGLLSRDRSSASGSAWTPWRGRPLGTGQTCIASIDGCDPLRGVLPADGARDLTLDLARGSLTVPIKLLEVWPTESSFIQVGRGEVSAGTGVYAAAKGHLAGGGAGAFDEQVAFTGRLVYVAELRGVR